MSNARKADKRKPRSQRNGVGRRKVARASADENDPPRARPKPRLVKKPSMSQSDKDAAELLMGLSSGSGTRNKARNPMNVVFDAVMGLTPEESAHLDADELELNLEKELEHQSDEEELHPDDDDVRSDDDSEEDEYKIKYEVPYKNATRELVLPSTTSFSKFLTALSKKMEVSVTHLAAIGYIPSWKPKSSKPLPKLLESADDYESMMDDIEEFRNTCLAKKGGKVKPFSICLSDTSVMTERGGTKGSSKKKEVQPAVPLEATEQQEHKLMAQIEKHHACQEHGGKACYVTASGEHYHYTNNDLVIWATLMRRNLASIDKVPDQLKVEDQIDRQRKAKRGLQASQTNTFAFNNAGMGMGGMWPPWMYMQPPPWMMPPNQGPAPAAANTPSPPRKRKYPTVAEWLQELDTDEDRGEDMVNYGQYAGILANIGIIRLDDLLEVGSAEKLQELTHMNWGNANRLMKFAQEDKRKIKKARTE